MFQKLNGTEIFLQSDVTVNQISPPIRFSRFRFSHKVVSPRFLLSQKIYAGFSKKKNTFLYEN